MHIYYNHVASDKDLTIQRLERENKKLSNTILDLNGQVTAYKESLRIITEASCEN